jgi:cyanophycinase
MIASFARGLSALLLGAVLVLPLADDAQSASATYRYFRVGSNANIKAHPQAGYALMGGGTDQDDPFRWLCDRADGGDFLILRATGTDAYNPYIRGLCQLNSVATLIIPDRQSAQDAFVAAAIANAAAIFIAGGDQANYIRNWAGSPVESALRNAVQRGVPVGGTSAGLAVLGQFIYSAENDQPDGPDLSSAVALSNPFAPQVVIAPDLLGIPVLRGIVTDSHFDTRQREGRLLVFMARVLESNRAGHIRAVGVDEKTALLVDLNGDAHVVGQGEVDFLEASVKPAICRPGLPLTFGPIQEIAVRTGGRFNLQAWSGAESPTLIQIRAGRISTARMR